MTALEAIVSMSMIVLRKRGQWHGGATAHDDIDLAVNQCSDLLPNPTRERCEMAIAELKRRGGPDPDYFPDRSDAVKQRECRARGEHKPRASGRRIA